MGRALSLERIRHFYKRLPVGLFEVVLARELAVVSVADKEHRLPIELVGEERRSAEVE
jgi:hypothetical protein